MDLLRLGMRRRRGWVEQTLTLQPSSANDIDTYIQNSDANANFSTATFFWVGERNDAASTYRALLKFDLSSLPDDAIISSAVLSLYKLSDGSSNARTFRVYRMKVPWSLGTVTWNNKAGGGGNDPAEVKHE